MNRRLVSLVLLTLLIAGLALGSAFGSPAIQAISIGVSVALVIEAIRPGSAKRTGNTLAPDNDAADFSTDAPIRSASEDLLRRDLFARRIAQVLSNPTGKDGRVFAIRGNWGHGKSSLKNLVIEVLESQRLVQWLEFNPWKWGDDTSIARGLFSQMAIKLEGARTPEAEARAKAIRRYGSLLVGGSGTLRAAGTESGLASWLTAVAIVAAGLGIGVPNLEAKYIAGGALLLSGLALISGKALAYIGRERVGSLDDARADVEARLHKAPGPLIVFVDDIDRLEPDQIRLLFRHVKVNANLPNIVFVLLFQPSIVEAALEPIAGTEGRQFLEKIVQASFDLPAVSVDEVHRIFTEQLSLVAGSFATEDNGFDQVRWGNMLISCIQPCIRNLRDARRLISSLAIHLPLHQGASAFEVNIIDFFGLETLRVFEPDFHGAIFRERDLVLQKHRYSGDRREDEQRQRLEALISVIPEGRRQAAKDAFVELFPTVEWAFNGSYFGSDWQPEWINAKRVCTSRYFDRYFAFQSAEGSISESEFVDFLHATTDGARLKRIVAEFEGRNLLTSLAARLDESVKRLPVENANVLLPEMYKIAQKLVQRTAADPFNAPWVSAWRAVSWFLHRVEPSERTRLAIASLKSSGALSVGAILISLDRSSREKDENDREALFDDKGLTALTNTWLRQMRSLAKSDQALLSHPDLLSLLYRWRDFTGTLNEPRKWVQRVSKNDRNFATLIAGFMGVGRSQTWGDRVGRTHETFQRETIEDLFGINRVDERVRNFDTSELPSNEVHALEVLRKHLDVWKGRENAGSGLLV